MKHLRLYLLCILIASVYFSCNKDYKNQDSVISSQTPFISDAMSWIKSNVSREEFQNLDFSKISTIRSGKEIIAAEIIVRNRPINKFLFLFKDGNRYTASWVEHLGLNSNLHSASEGMIKTESLDGSFKSEVTFSEGRPSKYIRTVNGETKIIKVGYPQANSINKQKATITGVVMRVQAREIDEVGVLPPVTVTTYIKNSYTTLYSLFYYNPPTAHSFSYTLTAPGVGSSSTVPSDTYSIFLAPQAAEIYKIGSISDYFKCFTNVAGSTNTYKVTVCVDQPVPGTREPWRFSGEGSATSSSEGNPVNVGHTFLILSQTTPTEEITRNIGFYPSTLVKPTRPEAQGQLMNNDDHVYNISLSITVTNSQFFTILDYVSKGNNIGYNYNVSHNNCTTFVLNALASAGMVINSRSGSWPNGEGKNPGDLGEDIRSMTLSSNMSKSTTSVSHPNLGTCYY